MVVHEITPISAPQESWKGFQGEQRSSGVFGTTCTSRIYTSQWDLAECIQGCWEGLPTSLQRHTATSLTGHGVWGASQLTGKGQILHTSTKTRWGKEIWEITDESTSLEYLEKLWSWLSWKLFLGMKKKKAIGRSQHIPQLIQPSPTVSSLLFASSLIPQRLGSITFIMKI